jgi:hypothetical protein
MPPIGQIANHDRAYALSAHPAYMRDAHTRWSGIRVRYTPAHMPQEGSIDERSPGRLPLPVEQPRADR